MKNLLYLLLLTVFFSYGNTLHGQSWFEKYTKQKTLYEGDNEELVRNISNKKFRDDFSGNIEKIILCHYAIDLDNKYNEKDKYYREIISLAKKDLEKKGYKVEVVWYNKDRSQFRNSETVSKSSFSDFGKIAIVEIAACCNYASILRSETNDKTVGAVKDVSGRTVAEYTTPSRYSYYEYYYDTYVYMWVWAYHQYASVECNSKTNRNNKYYKFSACLKPLLKNIPKRR